jgi:hypothetical protein
LTAQLLHRLGFGKGQTRRKFFSCGEFFLRAGQVALAGRQFGLNKVGFGTVGVSHQDLLHHCLRLV